ncbi:MAG: M3 family oligoendopeptidase [Christensenellaceae bacterium]|nr:M3 family oligoendopeptidase [Christensenellaceae bacterium]
MNKNGTWDLSFLYKGFDDPQLQADLAAIPEMLEGLRAILASDEDDKTKLERLMDAQEALSARTDRLSYVFMVLAVDATNATAAKYDDRLSLIFNDARLVGSAITRYIGSIPNLEELIASSEKLQKVAFALREDADRVKHTLPEAIEPWMLQMQLSGGGAFSQLRDKLDSTHLVSYRGQELPLAAVRGMAYDADPAVRKDAYEAEIAAYKKIELPMSYCLNSIKMEARTLSKARGFDSVLDMTLNSSRMDRETLDAMLTAMKEYLPHFRRYLRAKGKLLGHKNGLPFYDLFAPVGEATRSYTIDEARQTLIKELGKFNPEMAKFVDHAFEADWIDLYPREGKTGGAFCAGAHFADRSMVMTNFQGSHSDVSTIAHELGHAWHNRCMAGLPYALTGTPMPLAETASIFNETILAHQVLAAASEKEQLTLLDASLTESTQTIVDIFSRYLFESEVIDTRADHAMTVDELKDAMLRAQDATYGDGLDPEVRHPYMWACKSHYYSSGLNFYNFPYAFGELFGKGVFALYLEKGSDFVPQYNQLLRSCGSGTVVEVAASVGIDVHSVDFWRSSLEVIKQEIDRFCALCE